MKLHKDPQSSNEIRKIVSNDKFPPFIFIFLFSKGISEGQEFCNFEFR